MRGIKLYFFSLNLISRESFCLENLLQARKWQLLFVAYTSISQVSWQLFASPFSIVSLQQWCWMGNPSLTKSPLILSAPPLIFNIPPPMLSGSVASLWQLLCPGKQRMQHLLFHLWVCVDGSFTVLSPEMSLIPSPGLLCNLHNLYPC